MITAPYLVQRANIRTPLAEKTERLSRAVDFDYMGSAEFEFGALPRSFRRIESNLANFKRRTVTDILDGESSLRVWSYLSDEDFAEYCKYLRKMRSNRHALRMKEYPGFEADNVSKWRKPDFWWDIENDVMFSFHKNFMNRVGDYVIASLAYMNSKSEA